MLENFSSYKVLSRNPPKKILSSPISTILGLLQMILLGLWQLNPQPLCVGFSSLDNRYSQECTWLDVLKGLVAARLGMDFQYIFLIHYYFACTGRRSHDI